MGSNLRRNLDVLVQNFNPCTFFSIKRIKKSKKKINKWEEEAKLNVVLVHIKPLIHIH